MPDAERVTMARGLGNTSVRLHDLALQRWLNAVFSVVEGYPVPVIFAAPMDAFAEFNKLWQGSQNPFQYLLQARDEQGTPLYEPYPANARYPVVSVTHAGWGYRPNQSCATRAWHPLYWATVDHAPSRQDVGTAIVMSRPSAWDYRYKLVHMCRRPDTQARFVQQLMDAMNAAAGQAQTFIQVISPYPQVGYLARVALEGGIEDLTEHEPADGAVVFQTGFQLVVEGFSIPCSWDEVPVLWKTVLSMKEADATVLSQLYDFRQADTGALSKILPITRQDPIANRRSDGSSLTQLSP